MLLKHWSTRYDPHPRHQSPRRWMCGMRYCEHCGLADDITERCTLAEQEAAKLKSELASVRGELDVKYAPVIRQATAEIERLKGEQSEVSAQTTRLCTEISMLRDRADKYLSDWEKDADQLRESLLESQSYQDELNKREILMKDSLKEAYAALEFYANRATARTATGVEPGAVAQRARDKLISRHEWLGDV